MRGKNITKKFKKIDIIILMCSSAVINNWFDFAAIPYVVRSVNETV